MRRAARLLVVLAVAAGLTACGGDDGDDDAATGTGGATRFCELASRQGIMGLDDFDPARAEDVERLDDALTELADAAPSAIRDDVEAVARGVRELFEILGTIDTSDPDALSTLTERAEELEAMRGRMEASVARVGRYLEEECGIKTGS